MDESSRSEVSNRLRVSILSGSGPSGGALRGAARRKRWYLDVERRRLRDRLTAVTRSQGSTEPFAGVTVWRLRQSSKNAAAVMSSASC